jgi:hypothetical protein
MQSHHRIVSETPVQVFVIPQAKDRESFAGFFEERVKRRVCREAVDNIGPEGFP